MPPGGASPRALQKRPQRPRCHRFHAATAAADARAPCALRGIPARAPSNEMIVIPSANKRRALRHHPRQFSHTKTALARTGLHRLVPVPDASSKTSLVPSAPIGALPNHPASHTRALDQDAGGASSFPLGAALLPGDKHIPGIMKGFYFSNHDQYKA